MNSVTIELSRNPSPSQARVEIVERKGLGHPDTICDLIMDRVSVDLCAAYTEAFGSILHHNCDKGLLLAGQARHAFDGGQLTKPMKLIFGGQAAFVLGGKTLDVRSIAIEAAREWLRQNLPRVDPLRHVEYQVELLPGSEQLTSIFTKGTGRLVANDTSAAVGYAPLTECERIVLNLERHVNSPAFKSVFPESGEDVKIMAVRKDRKLTLTVAMPLADARVSSEHRYFERKQQACDAIRQFLIKELSEIDQVIVELNALDSTGTGSDGCYLTVVGTSAESGDSGAVGRGNRVNGLIPLLRPRGAEAAAGKNPVSHVGKIYNVLSDVLARQIVAEVAGVAQTTVWLCSRIGAPINKPSAVSVQVEPIAGATLADLASPIERLVQRELEQIDSLCAQMASGLHPIA